MRFIYRFAACLDALDQIYHDKKEPVVFGLSSSVTNKHTLMMILLLCDVLRPANVLSESLQKADINFMDVDTKVRAAIDELQTLTGKLENRRNHTELYFSKCDQVLAEITDRTDLQRRQIMVTISYNQKNLFGRRKSHLSTVWLVKLWMPLFAIQFSRHLRHWRP